jgi:hypothetical protein
MNPAAAPTSRAAILEREIGALPTETTSTNAFITTERAGHLSGNPQCCACRETGDLCGIIGADARPNWREHRAQGAGAN